MGHRFSRYATQWKKRLHWKPVLLFTGAFLVVELGFFFAAFAHTPHAILGKFRAALSDDETFSLLLREDESFRCLREGFPCGGGAVHRLSHGSALLYEPTDIGGWNAFGFKCALFDERDGSLTCPFRVDVTWRPVCLNGSCERLQIHFVLQLRSRTGVRLLDRVSAEAIEEIAVPTTFEAGAMYPVQDAHRAQEHGRSG